MIAAWMLYAMVVAGLVGFAAVACERMLRLAGQPARWAWCGAFVTSVGVPLYELLHPAAPAAAPIPISDAGTTVIDPAVLLGLLNAPAASPTISALTGLVVGVWAVASLILAAVLLGAQARIRRETNRCPAEIVDGVLVRFTSDLGPAVIGSFPSIIVVPAWVRRLEFEARRLVLSHEKQHIEAGDIRLLSAGLVLAVLMPWNLPLWWQLRRLRDAVELDCDERVLKSGADARRYSELLLEVARHRTVRVFPAPALSNPKSLLARRIHKMMHPNPKARTARAGVAAAVATLLVALACETPTPAAVEFDSEQGTATTVSGVDLSQTFTEAAVDTLPERLSGPLPRYPEMLRQAGIEGSVRLEFVIDTTGSVEEESIKVLQASNRAFEGPAKDVIARSLYRPGKVGDDPVRTLVSQQIGFTIASAEQRRMALAEAAEQMRVLRRATEGREGASLGQEGAPLFVVDGVPLDGTEHEVQEALSNLSPDDIRSIEVIKGDAAATIYGEAGANGVIQIYTTESNAITVTGRRLAPVKERN
jgi:TonB family protein